MSLINVTAELTAAVIGVIVFESPPEFIDPDVSIAMTTYLQHAQFASNCRVAIEVLHRIMILRRTHLRWLFGGIPHRDEVRHD